MKKTILLSVIAASAMGVSAQKNVGEFLNAGKADAQLLAKEYLRPYGEVLGSNLNSGWYNSASPHKLLGFDVTLSASYTMMPSSAKTFDMSKLNLATVDYTKPIAPTMAGKMSSSEMPKLYLKGQDPNVVGYIDLPNGSGTNAMAMPMIQAGVGLPFHSEIMLRYMPDVKLGDYGKLGLWGVGVKHSLKEYVPFLKSLPALNVSVLGAYTKFSSGMSLPDNDVLKSGNLDISSGAYTTRLLVGANLPVVAFYTGVGYGNATSDFDITGSYNGAASERVLGLNYKTSAVDFNAGVRLRLGVIALHADYSLGDYQMVTAGLGVSFR